jgi:hypothetical protein
MKTIDDEIDPAKIAEKKHVVVHLRSDYSIPTVEWRPIHSR